MHIITSDMNSPHMNTKRLWNMFNSDHFVSVDDVIATLEKQGRVEVGDLCPLRRCIMIDGLTGWTMILV